MSYAYSIATVKPYTLSEVLHYADGSKVVHSTKTLNRQPSMAVSRITTAGTCFTFWNDHDPRIVAVEFIYTAA